MKEMLLRGWNSPTFMTWGSYLSRSLSMVVVLPLLLTKLQTAEISLWYLFMSIIGLQSVVDAGFSPTFSRIIAYVMGGASIYELKAPQGAGTGTFDRQALNQVYSTMRKVYIRLGLVWTLLLITVGTVALIKPIAAVHGEGTAWLAWGIIIVVSSISFRGEQYSSFLQGINQIVLLRRWETLTSLGAIVTIFLVLALDGGLLALVVANQGWQLINVARNRWLARTVENGMLHSFAKLPFNKQVFDAVWPSAWRSGVGVLMSYGLIQSSGVIYAQFGETDRIAMYLLGLRLIQTVNQFSQAPFSSKIPVLARLYADARRDELLRLAQRGMKWTYWTYVIGFTMVGFIGVPLFKFINSHAPFPDPLLWSLMGFAFFIERYGAMHIQLYSTTNHIIWHIANGITGIINIIVSLSLLNYIGIYAFPVGMIAGYIAFYSWYSAKHSYNAFEIRILSYERSCSVIPGLLLLASIITQIIIFNHMT